MFGRPMTRDGEGSKRKARDHRRKRQKNKIGAVAAGARGALSVAMLLIFLISPMFAHAAAFDINDKTWEGCSDFLDIARGELGVARVEAVAVLDWNQVRPEDGVLVLHPLQTLDAEESTAFMKEGGRLAIVDDFGRGDETLRRFQIERMSTPSRPVAALRNRSVFAIAEPVIDTIGGHAVGPHPVVSQVKQLVTNHPSGLRHPNLSPVLRIRAIGEPDVIIAVAGQVGQGRLFAMSDPSAIINLMLQYPGNRAFAAGLVRYLVDEDAPQPRRGKLFVVANRFDEDGSFGGETSLRKDIDAHLKSIVKALEDARRDGFPSWLLIALAVLAAAGLTIWVVRASAKPYKSPLPRYARPTPLVAQGGAAGRLAVLAAPSSPRSLAFLELKSALFEALAMKFGLGSDLSPDALARLVAREGSLDEKTYASFKEILTMMHRVEASVVAGRHVNVSRSVLANAAEVVRDVLTSCQADRWLPFVPTPSDSKPTHQPAASPKTAAAQVTSHSDEGSS